VPKSVTHFLNEDKINFFYFFSTNKSYVQNGGGLVVAGEAWQWATSGVTVNVTYANGYPGNK